MQTGQLTFSFIIIIIIIIITITGAQNAYAALAQSAYKFFKHTNTDI